ncbi:DUF2347 superfamily protein [Delphinella strobiligena]|nr:DUF2347 superfamily protein [Delphinella strobiligena]
MIANTDSSTRQAVPPISALFLVVFDQKVGYSVAYSHKVPGLQLEGVVEYKSLPSGLHNVQSDLVYFVHDQYAGISAFASRPAEETERNAHFAAVGVLVPLSYGRLGRSWLHAESLRELAKRTVNDLNDTDALDDYWNTHGIHHAEEQGQDGKDTTDMLNRETGHRKKTRAPADAAALEHTQVLSRDHPALSLASHLDMLGPLLFPLYRAALLRKRILILTHAPVHEACNLVYNVSVLSNTPPGLVDVLPDSDALSPIRPLFNVGVHDIPHLSDISKSEGGQASYLACSTDEILATKHSIYDILVELPQGGSDTAGVNQWPKLRTAEGDQIKATQRDLRRYRALKKELQRIERSGQGQHREWQDVHESEEQRDSEEDNETRPLVHATRSVWEDEDDELFLDGEGNLVEPMTWAAMAYTGFLWWASAGEKDTWLEDEAAQDSTLLADLPLPEDAGCDSPGSGGINGDNAGDEPEKEAQTIAMLLIAFSHRLTAMTLESMSELVQAADEEAEDAAEQRAVTIGSEDLRRMGLDVWSEVDREFARELLQLYFHRDGEVKGQGVECCGMKIC